MVEDGFYRVGFQVNNAEYLRLIFGKSTCIGAYNALFMVRHEWIFKTATPLSSFAIRVQRFNEIFNDMEQFKRPMRRKVVGIYARNLYFPLMKMKREVINAFSQRKDYEQFISA